MKNIFIPVVILIFLSCCSRKPSDDPLALGPYPREVCELIVSAQVSPMIDRFETSCSLRNEAERCLAGDTTRHTRAVKLYMDEALWHRGNNNESRLELLDSALHLVDSGNYPVMMHRIRAEILKLKVQVPFDKNLYFEIKREIDYFGDIGDTLAMGLLEVLLGSRFHDVGLIEEAMEITQKAMKGFNRIGQPRFEGLTRINEALNYEALGDKARRDSVNKILLSDKDIKDNSPYYREGLLRNAYQNVWDTAYLNEGWQIVQSDSGLRARSTGYYALFADRMLEENNADSALRLLRLCQDAGRRYGFPDDNHKLLMLSVKAKAFDMKKESDSALRYLKLALNLRDSMNARSSAKEVMRTTYGQEIKALKYEQELQRNRDRWIWTIVFIVLVISAMAGFLWVWKLRQSTKLRLVREQAEMEHTRHELAANMLAKQEKDNLLTEMNRHINRMTSEGHMSHTVASDLQTMIRLHETGQKEWKAFEELLVKIRPRFMSRLHEQAPDMSIKYCRLAAYIYVGMSSQQIASLMMIGPKSVYQARWRLRRQLAVPEGEGLEEYLEHLGSE